MKKIFKVAAALLFCSAITQVNAENFYGAVDFGQSKGSDICTNLPAGINGCKDTGTLLRIAGGVQLAPIWGVEASYADLGNGSAGTGLGLTGTWKASALQISGIGTFPVANGFSIIGKLGIVRADLELSGSYLGTGFNYTATTSNVAYGIGAQFDLSNKTALRAQYDSYGTLGDAVTTGTTKASSLSVGLLFKFN